MESGLDQSALMRVCDVTHSTSLLKGIQHDGLMDVMFICRGNVKVYSQKLVLISVSPFMKVLLSHVSCCPHTMFCLSLPDINPVALEQVLNFLYEGIMKVCGSELQDFSDAMYVLGIEVPETATATLLDSFDVPKSRTCTQPPQVASQHSVGEPVDPLNVPDYYHDPTSVACVGLPPTLVAPDASSASPMNATPLNRAVESMKPAAGGRVLGSGLAKTTMSRTRPELVVIVIPDDVDQFFEKEAGESHMCGMKGSTSSNMCVAVVKQEPAEESCKDDAQGLRKEEDSQPRCALPQSMCASSKQMKNIRLALDTLQELNSRTLLKKTTATMLKPTINLRKRKWPHIFNIYQFPRTNRRLSKRQYEELERAFQIDGNISREQRKELAKSLDLNVKRVETWFKNRLKKQRKDIFRSQK